eukprot:3652977-Prymnesium_polylepis.1
MHPAWRSRFGRALPCESIDPQRDFDPDECLPYVLPPASAREVCSGADDYEYEGSSLFEME